MKHISTPSAPTAIGPYSQAVIANGFVFCSGQIGLSISGNLVSDKIEDQVHQVIKNLDAVLQSAGSSLMNVVKTVLYLNDINDFSSVNEIYGQYFSHKPARATVQVSALPKAAKIEIECVAIL